jgi:hypothetical protein
MDAQYFTDGKQAEAHDTAEFVELSAEFTGAAATAILLCFFSRKEVKYVTARDVSDGIQCKKV